MTDKIKKQGEQINTLCIEFKSFKEVTNGKLDEIFDSLKPQFSDFQIVGFLISLVVLFSGVMIYAEGVKSNTRNNETRIEFLEDNKEVQRDQYQIIIKSLSEIKTDIAVLKSESKLNK